MIELHIYLFIKSNFVSQIHDFLLLWKLTLVIFIWIYLGIESDSSMWWKWAAPAILNIIMILNGTSDQPSIKQILIVNNMLSTG